MLSRNRKAIKGDRDSINEILLESKEEMYKIAKSRLRNEEDVLDAIQDTVVIILNNINKVKKPEYLKTWMMRILINKCNDIYKSKKREIEIKERIIKENHEDNSLEQTESNINMEKVLEKLKYKERLTLSLYYGSNFSIEEISKIMKEPKNTIKTRLRRCKNKIKKFIGDKYE